jgi:hypothetical protein
MKVYQDNHRKELMNATLKSVAPIINEAVLQFNKLPLKKITKPEQVMKLFNLDEFLVEMLPESEPQKMFGITLKPAKVVDMLDLDLSELKKSISRLPQRETAQFLEASKFTRNGLEIDPDKFEQLLEGFNIIAITPRQKEVAKTYQTLVEAFTKMLSYGLSKQIPINTLFINNSGKIDINPSVYRKLVD